MMTCYLWKYLTEIIIITVSAFICVSGQENLREIKFSDVLPIDYDYLRSPTVNGKNREYKQTEGIQQNDERQHKLVKKHLKTIPAHLPDFLHYYLNAIDTPVVVNITIRDVNIRSIDESDMSFSVVITLWQGWTDYRLNYPSWIKAQYQVLDSRWVDKLWTPNLYFVNAVEGKMNNIITPSSFFWISEDKRVFYCVRLILKLVCEMNLVHFPHDEQQCGVKMAPAFYNDKLLVLNFTNFTRSGKEFSSLQQFEITGVVKQRCNLATAATNVSCLEEAVVLRRRSGYYLINVYIPTVLIVVMSMLTFWIPHDAVPARITLGVTSLLTIITKQYQASMPSVSYIVALNIWLSSCIAFVFFSLLEYAAVIAMTKTKKSNHLFRDSPDLILPMVLLKANGTWSTKQCWSNNLKHQKGNLGPKRLDFFSRLFFPLSFFVFCVSYWRYYS